MTVVPAGHFVILPSSTVVRVANAICGRPAGAVGSTSPSVESTDQRASGTGEKVDGAVAMSLAATTVVVAAGSSATRSNLEFGFG